MVGVMVATGFLLRLAVLMLPVVAVQVDILEMVEMRVRLITLVIRAQEVVEVAAVRVVHQMPQAVVVVWVF
jgi:hypothetical protein